jgi:lambda family phage tail tape measure protein
MVVYIEINAETKHFRKALDDIKKQSGIGGGLAASNFQSSFGNSMRNLSREFSTAFNSLKMTKIKIPMEPIREFAKEIGMAEYQYKALAERMAKNTAYKNAENSFKRIAEVANLNSKEMKNLATQMGFTDKQTKTFIENMKGVDVASGGMSDTLQKCLKVISSFTIIKTTLNGVFSSFNYMAESLNKVAGIKLDAANAGLDVDTYSKFSYVAERARLSVDSFTKSYENLQKSAAQAVSGNTEKLKIFKNLNIDAKDFMSLHPEEQLKTIAKALDGFSRGDQLTITDKLFGGNGREFIGLLQQGGAELDRLFSKANQNVKIFSDDDIEKAHRAAEAYSDMQGAVKRLGTEFDLFLSGKIQRISEGLATFIDWYFVDTERTDDIVKRMKERSQYLHWLKESEAKIEELNKKIAGRVEQNELRLSKGYSEDPLMKTFMTQIEYEKGQIERFWGILETHYGVKRQATPIETKEAKSFDDTDTEKLKKDADDFNKFIDSINSKTFNIQFKDDPLKQLEEELKGITAQAVNFGKESDSAFIKALKNYKAAREAVINLETAQKEQTEQEKIWKEAAAESKGMSDFLKQIDDEYTAALTKTGTAAEELDKKLTAFYESAYARKLPVVAQDQYAMKIKETHDAIQELKEDDFAKSIKDQIEALKNTGEPMAKYEASMLQHENAMEKLRKVAAEYGEETLALINTLDELGAKKIKAELEFEIKPEGVLEGLKSGVDGYLESLPTMGESVSDMVKNSMNGMTESVAEFAASGKFSFKDFTDSVIKDLTRMAVQQAILAPLLNGLFSGGGGGGKSRTPTFNTGHTGGIVGQLSGAKKEVSPLVFAAAPRFHSGGVLGGLGAGEYPIIAKRGEGIFTPEQMRALSPSQPPQVNVNVQNNTSSKVTVKQSYNGNGGVDIDARIESAMTAAAANRSSNFNQALNTSRRLVRR